MPDSQSTVNVAVVTDLIEGFKDLMIHFSACLEDIRKHHLDNPSTGTIGLVDELKKDFNALREEQLNNEKEHRNMIEKHNLSQEKHLTDIKLLLSKVYTRKDVEEKFASKKTETWFDRAIWIALASMIGAIVSLVIKVS